MTWIESHQELGRHPKTKKLARLLRVSVPAAIGHLHLLWWWATDYAPDGDLSSFDLDDVAEAMLWPKTAEVLIDALKEAAFLDEDLYIHDWDEYAGKLIERRKSDAERKRSGRRPTKEGESQPRRPPDVRRTSDAARTPSGVPYLTEQTGPNKHTGHTGQTEQTGPDAPPDAAPDTSFSSPSSDAILLDALERAFTERGLPNPVKTKADRASALDLLQVGYQPEIITACWLDIRDNGYGGDFARQHLSFEYLAKHNRLGNWIEQQHNGTAVKPSGRPLSHAEAARDPHRFDDLKARQRAQLAAEQEVQSHAAHA